MTKPVSHRSKWLKLVLSVFLLYHLTAVLLMPNLNSTFTRHYGFLFLPYANLLGLNTPWQFFSPDPSSHVYFEYEVIPRDSSQEVTSHRWPPLDRKSMLADNSMRLVYHSRFVSSSPQRIETFFIPWLCRLHPEAAQIELRTLSEELLPLEKAALVGGPLKNLLEIRAWSHVSQSCPDSSEESASAESSSEDSESKTPKSGDEE